jgi:hypothetical protein
MKNEDFDRLAQRLAAAGSRRGLLKAFAGGLAGVVAAAVLPRAVQSQTPRETATPPAARSTDTPGARPTETPAPRQTETPAPRPGDTTTPGPGETSTPRPQPAETPRATAAPLPTATPATTRTPAASAQYPYVAYCRTSDDCSAYQYCDYNNAYAEPEEGIGVCVDCGDFCGSVCCAAGQTCSNGACCGAGTFGCGGICCDQGQSCIAGNTCCGTDRICGPNCCCAPDTTSCGSGCCPSGSGCCAGVCCDGGEGGGCFEGTCFVCNDQGCFPGGFPPGIVCGGDTPVSMFGGCYTQAQQDECYASAAAWVICRGACATLGIGPCAGGCDATFEAFLQTFGVSSPPLYEGSLIDPKTYCGAGP